MKLFKKKKNDKRYYEGDLSEITHTGATYKKYNQIKQNFPTTKGTERLFYRIEDLELINYLYNGGNFGVGDFNTKNIR